MDSITHQPFQIKLFLHFFAFWIHWQIYAQSCLKDSTSPDGFPTPDSAEQKPEGHSGNMEQGSGLHHISMAEYFQRQWQNLPLVFFFNCDGSPDLGQFWRVKR